MSRAALPAKRRVVPLLRAFIARHRWAAALLIAAALAMKLVVPAGFMPVRTAGTMVIAICNGIDAHSIAIDLKTGEKNPADARADPPCGFGGMAPLDLGQADPWLLTAAIAFILALGFAAVALPRLRAFPRTLPPLRGPPATF